ncbi:hypothetical protein [Butyricicoccus intestinisimiae]|uniref:Uncharacterized protein n=1 Tax=Butyricicoccus intestinisimiae TaxID=2841509 RepID=A0ABS6EVU9_9FIRM|nr:hypothetical protein [Butyricicoccus intestinisimiae]MBU5491302.1 hypothetical protein [Butyricicoccus intestinisimiae]
MITLNTYMDAPSHAKMELVAKSTDSKPIKIFDGRAIGNGSTLYEMDTKKIYIYDEDEHKWWEM